jgi:hypothetical protein
MTQTLHQMASELAKVFDGLMSGTVDRATAQEAANVAGKFNRNCEARINSCLETKRDPFQYVPELVDPGAKEKCKELSKGKKF